MGASQSARKLTISNEEELGVIHISNGVAQRLAQGVSNNVVAAPAPAISDVRVGATSPIKEPAVPSPLQPAPPAYGYPVQLHPEYTISALKMQQQKEEELNNQNVYWQKRLQKLKENHAMIDKILEDEYRRAVEQVAAAQGKRLHDMIF